MPPVFGIVRTDLQMPDREMISRMSGCARYIVPRRQVTVELPGIWMAAALHRDHPAKVESNVLYRQGNLAIAADASLYNRRELIYRLGNKLQEGESGDAALILRAYEKWGDRCLEYLYGDFAFLIFNTVNGEIFCGRDPMGVRPFFYTRQGNSFIFSSEIRMILGALEKKPEIGFDYLLDSLVTVKSPKDKSPFENIFKLPPAHFLNCKNGAVTINSYWLPDASVKIDLPREEEYIDMFRELLVHAVNMRCEGVQSLGSELSGGLDSSAVTGLAAEFAEREKTTITAYSNIFPEGTGMDFKDEREFIRAMLAFKPVTWQGIHRLGMPVTDLLKYTLDIQGTFIQQNFSVFNYGLYKAAGEAGSRVLLSGFGGDELVSARVSLPWNELIRERQWQVIRDEIFYRGITPKSLLKPGLIAARYLYSQFYRPAYRTGVFTPELLGKRLITLPLQPDFLKQHELENRYREKFRFPVLETLSSRQLFRINMEHIPQRMEYCYTAAAQFGLEYRYPLLDVNLMLACLAFPPRVKQHHGVNRSLFRQAITGCVPEAIQQRNDKSGTTIPHTYHSLITEKDQILDLIKLCSDLSRLKEIFDFTRFGPWYEKLVRRDPKDMNTLMPGAFYDYLMIMLYYKSNE
jgi:asparagine synthase (glutamine-hydrolysing)